MTCPNCGNYNFFDAIGGICFKRCSSCVKFEKGVAVPELTIHAIRGAQTSSSTSAENRKRMTECLSYDDTLLRLDDVLCKKCSSPVRVWVDKNHSYIYICQKCAGECEPVDKK
jgi:hypothetical protein